MVTKKRRKHWSKNLNPDGGRQIRVYERPETSLIWYSVMTEAGKVRRSLETGDRAEAEKRAEAIAIGLAKEDEPTTSADLQLGQLFRAYDRHYLPTLSPARQREAEARIVMFVEAWSEELRVTDVDATRVRSYCTRRRSLKIVAPGKRPDEEGNRRRGYRQPKPIRDGGLDAEFRWLNSVFNWACGFKTAGKPLLNQNPLPGKARGRRAIGWPKESNVRRPVASHRRYTATSEHTRDIDPEGRLSCILALARWTGRRESAICSLMASDLLLSPDRVRAGLAVEGMDERRADHMPHGAIRWDADRDKQGFSFITPLNRDAREALDTYLRATPRVGEAPLFPAPRKLHEPISRQHGREVARQSRECRWAPPSSKEASFIPTGGCGQPRGRAYRLWTLQRPVGGRTPRRSDYPINSQTRRRCYGWWTEGQNESRSEEGGAVVLAAFQYCTHVAIENCTGHRPSWVPSVGGLLRGSRATAPSPSAV